MSLDAPSYLERWEQRDREAQEAEARWWRRETRLMRELHADGQLDDYLRAQWRRRLSFTGEAIGAPEWGGPFWARLERAALIAAGRIRSAA